MSDMHRLSEQASVLGMEEDIERITQGRYFLSPREVAEPITPSRPNRRP